ncbi:hypothetical protein A6B43_06835 [Vespertiliibacter pulmonis]|uniref:Uncharacterized membrane protein YhaH (DUF805 family) n=1 Tax=Vespertiliibacter pulmonis TaxID=1443036 RepID=A0A3N4VRD5_9PAST|nr:DUF805 domain-containing protein [Vespertiliibacter pulmonis]QLB21252.1 hypothetical protein A6B43_06835 [Vespertiliibacter pulmonis]RPE85656.1 uncharacterized membrane protein YhaH (DUF805 family) [Vespertiliibacter pulmonis]
MNWYLEVLKKYAVFSGRARRREYWMFILLSNIISLGLLYVDYQSGSLGRGLVISNIYSLAVLLPALAVGVRRLHDTGRSGWWVLLILFPLIMIYLSIYLAINGITADLVLPVSILGLIMLISFIVLMCKDSQSGENKYGPNPKGIDNK